MGLLAQGSLGAKGVEIVQSPPIPPPTTPRVCVCVCVCVCARAHVHMRTHHPHQATIATFRFVVPEQVL